MLPIIIVILISFLFISVIFILFKYNFKNDLKEKKLLAKIIPFKMGGLHENHITIRISRCKINPNITEIKKVDEHMDIQWFYDDKTSQLIWLIPENFFRFSQEKLEKSIEQLNLVSSDFCELCNCLMEECEN